MNKKIIFAMIATLSVLLFIPVGSVSAADARTYKAGRIIDDTIFTNKDSMTVGQIQNFLNSKAVCDTYGSKRSELGGGTRAQWLAANGISTPITCLRDYHENPLNGANNYGRAIPAGAISAAQIIYNYSQQFGINPQAILATLQKENGLITDEWPTPRQYTEAMGFGCPDNVAPGAPACNPAYKSFSTQVYQAARHFRGFYDKSPGWWIPFDTGNNAIRWSPTASCGSSNVNIVNRSTVALYSYTPYQPNQAALNAQYGTGNGCSAYGNRNFFLFFTDWFGVAVGAQDLVTDGTNIYYLSNGYKYYVPSMGDYYNYGYNDSDLARIVRTSAAELAAIPNRSGMGTVTTVIASAQQGIFLVSNGYKYYVPSMALLYSYGFNDNDIMLVTESSLNRFQTASRNLGRFVHDSDGFAYMLEGGKRRGIYQPWVLNKYTDSSTSNLISGVTLAKINIGIPITDGRLALSAGNTLYVAVNGKWFNVASADVANCIGVEGTITMSLNKATPGISSGSIGSCYVKDENNAKYLIDKNVKYTINSNDQIQYSSINSVDAIASMPTISYENHKNIFATKDGIFKLDEGKVRHIQSMEYVREVTGKDTVRVLNVNSLKLLEKGANIYRDGILVSGPNRGIYFMNNSVLSYISSMELFNAYGFNLGAVANIGDTEIDRQQKGASLPGMRVKCENVHYIISGGTKYSIATADLAHFGGTANFINIDCKAISVSKLSKMTRFITTKSSNNIYYIEDNRKRHILSWNTFTSMGGTSKDVIFLEFSTFQDIPNGSSL